MIINGTLRDFACNAIAKGQITLGDVRRLQRGYLPGGITNREELEILISLNGKLIRADKAWAQWLVSVIADFVTTGEANERPLEDAASKWIERLFAAGATKLGLRIARQIRRELSRPRASQSTGTEEGVQTCDVQQPRQVRATDNLGDYSLQKNPVPKKVDESPCSRKPRHIGSQARMPRTMTLGRAAHDWCLATYVRNIQRSDLINFYNSRVSVALAPCL